MEALHANPPAVKQRNAGIDLLRVVAVYYVIVLHIIGQGGLINAVGEGTFQYFACIGLLCWSMCAVNIFGMISGYVGYTDEEKPQNYKSYLFLWLEVAFYDIVLTLLTLWLRPGTAQSVDLIQMFLPVLSGGHWYFTAYTGLFLFIPLINTAVRHCSEKMLIRLLVGIVFVLSPVETLFRSFLWLDGYSFVWLMLLYLIGAILKKTQLGSKIHPLAAFAGIAALFLCTFLIDKRWIQVNVCGFLFNTQMAEKYVCPLHLLSAILYIILFSKLKPGPIARKLIAFAAPGAFSVYVINTQRHVWNGYMKDHFASWAGSSPIGIAVRVLLTAAVFVAVSLVADYFRRLLFRVFRKRKA